jgi:hypothetical protein
MTAATATVSMTTTKATKAITAKLARLDADFADAAQDDQDAQDDDKALKAEAKRALDDLAAAGLLSGQTHTALRPLNFVKAEEILSKQFPPTQWLVDGLIPKASVVAIAGEPKAKKTWAAMEIALAVASGRKAFGEFRTRAPADVFMVLVESNEVECQARLRSIMKGAGGGNDLGGRLTIAALQGLNLTDPNALALLVAKIRTMAPKGIGLLFLDPLRDLHLEEEKDSGGMSQVMGALRALRTVLDCSVVFIHHMSKKPDGASGSSRRSGQRMRGSGVIHASIDAGLYMEEAKGGDGEASFRLSVESETRNGRAAGRFILGLDIEDDDQRLAVSAAWSFNRPDAADLDEKMAKVLDVLRAATKPLAYTAVATLAKIHKKTTLARLREAERLDFARCTEDGEWVRGPRIDG